MADSILKSRSYEFALKIVRLSRDLSNEQREYVISRQILRSGTSIGANIEEAFQGESKPDFIHKLSIANKEAFETYYWLRLLRDSELITVERSEMMLKACDELQRILVASIKTAKSRK